jgi:hypothetical protein
MNGLILCVVSACRSTRLLESHSEAFPQAVIDGAFAKTDDCSKQGSGSPA